MADSETGDPVQKENKGSNISQNLGRAEKCSRLSKDGADHPVSRTGKQPLCQLTGYDLAEQAGVNGESNRAAMKSLSQLHAKGVLKKQKLSVALLETPDHNSYCRSLYLGAYSTDHILRPSTLVTQLIV